MEIREIGKKKRERGKKEQGLKVPGKREEIKEIESISSSTKQNTIL